jgi:hypothetical protein
MEQMRAALEPALARNANLKVSAKVASNHSKILRNDSRAIADAVRELAATRDYELGRAATDGVTIGKPSRGSGWGSGWVAFRSGISQRNATHPAANCHSRLDDLQSVTRGGIRVCIELAEARRPLQERVDQRIL